MVHFLDSQIYINHRIITGLHNFLILIKHKNSLSLINIKRSLNLFLQFGHSKQRRDNQPIHHIILTAYFLLCSCCPDAEVLLNGKIFLFSCILCLTLNRLCAIILSGSLKPGRWGELGGGMGVGGLTIAFFGVCVRNIIYFDYFV